VKRYPFAVLGVAFTILALAGAGLAAAQSPAAENSLGAHRTAIESSGTGLGGAIPRLRVLDGFGRQEVPLATRNWTKTAWNTEIGGSWRAPWHGYGATLSHRAGAYWNRATFDDSNGPVVVAATLGSGPIKERWSNEFLSLWIDMPSPGRTRSGYEVRFDGAQHKFTDYTVELSRWVTGRRTVLAKRSKVSVPVNTMFALSEAAGNLVVWTGTNTLTPTMLATDATYSGGYAGIEANRGEGTAYNFRAGNVAEAMPPESGQGTAGAALALRASR
jgi:hypothetical protein